MEKILVVLHVGEDGAVAKAGRECLAAALDAGTKLGAEIAVGLIGGSVDAAAGTIAGCGAKRILAVEGAEFAASRYASDVAAAEALVKAAGATIVLAPASSRSQRSLPGLAARLGAAIETRVTGLTAEGGALKVQRWYYRQRMMATLSRAARPWILLVESGVFAAAADAPGTVSFEKISVALADDAKRTTVIGVEKAAGGAQTIKPDAAILFVAGAGWTKKQSDGQTHVKDAEQLIVGFIEKAQASLGSSKSLVDQSVEGQEVLTCLTHLNQVGQTGSTPRHPKGLSTCCHGEEPHVVGWRFINDRRAVNLDANCGWAQGKADVLYIADAFAVMAKVNEMLAK